MQNPYNGIESLNLVFPTLSLIPLPNPYNGIERALNAERTLYRRTTESIQWNWKKGEWIRCHLMERGQARIHTMELKAGCVGTRLADALVFNRIHTMELKASSLLWLRILWCGRRIHTMELKELTWPRPPRPSWQVSESIQWNWKGGMSNFDANLT